MIIASLAIARLIQLHAIKERFHRVKWNLFDNENDAAYCYQTNPIRASSIKLMNANVQTLTNDATQLQPLQRNLPEELYARFGARLRTFHTAFFFSGFGQIPRDHIKIFISTVGTDISSNRKNTCKPGSRLHRLEMGV